MSKQNLYLLDAYALIYRAYFAFISRPRINSKQQNTSAIYGFLLSFREILNRPDASYIAVAFDTSEDTFRHKIYPEYKATREASPEAIRFAIPYIKKIVQAYGVKIYEKPGYEADDIVGTIAHRMEHEKGTRPDRVFLVSPDKDYAQLVTDYSHLMRPVQGGGFEILSPNDVKEKYGFSEPSRMIDYLALMGDSSDNIPGCAGVGEKSAAKLLAEYPEGIEQIYEHLDEIKGALKKKLEAGKDMVALSKTLVTIDKNVPIDVVAEECLVKEKDVETLREIFSELEFRSFMDTLSPAETGGDISSSGTPMMRSLFDRAEEPAPSEAPAAPGMKGKYLRLTSEEECKALVEEIRKAGLFAFDTETDGLDSQSAGIVGASFAYKEGEGYYLPLPEDQEEAEKELAVFRPLFEDPEILKIGQNIKFDLGILRRYGITSHGRQFDTMVAHYLIDPELSHGMDYLSSVYLNYKPQPITELIGERGKKQLSMRDVEVDKVVQYAAEDADVTLRLYHVLRKKIEADAALKKLFYDLEMPLTMVLVDMEAEGVTISTETLSKAKKGLEERLYDIEKSIHELAGLPFNINSPKEVGTILFEHLRLVEKPKKTKTGAYETREETLQKLKSKHPIIEQILQYRGIRKLLSTYVDALPELINPKTGRIHTSFNQTVTATGRLSSTNPNLQNIPVRDDDGKEIRRAFIANYTDSVFLSADYSQIELRLMAHLSQDPAMIEAFKNGMDIHTATAAKVFHTTTEEVTSDMRRKAKTANFGIIYGITPFGLSERLGIPPKEAKEIIDGYFASFPQVKAYMDKSIENAAEKGYVETIMGRRRYLKDIHSGNSVVRGFAERNAINAPIQGSAADIIKLAMVRIAERFRRERIRSTMMLQVHDELNFSVFKDELDRVKQIVREEMEQVYPEITIPLTVDIGVGENWLEAH